jgi:ribonuclease Z
VRPATIRLADLTLEGFSRAGDATWLRVQPPGLALDAGRGALQLAGARDLFLTHGHLDHALGVPFVLSQRTLHRAAATRVHCPREIAADVAAFADAAGRLEGVRYRYEVVPLAPGDRVPVGKDLAVEAFAVDHVVASLGYTLIATRHRLAEPYRGLAPAELAALRERGVAITEPVEERRLSYCGDTGPGVFERSPAVLASRVLVVECTFLGAAQREKGAQFKHLHIDDLAAQEEALAAVEALVLIHLSRRHKPAELAAAVGEKLPRLAGRVHFLLGEG